MQKWNYVIHMKNNNENLKWNDYYTFLFEKSLNDFNSKLICNLNINFANAFQICYCLMNLNVAIQNKKHLYMHN